MKARWGEKMIEVKRIKIKESKMGNLKQSMQNFAFKEPEIKYLGQRVSHSSYSLWSLSSLRPFGARLSSHT